MLVEIDVSALPVKFQLQMRYQNLRLGNETPYQMEDQRRLMSRF